MTKKNNQTSESINIVCTNKQARRDYEILDSWEAGIALLGSEVKSIRNGAINIKESYIRLINNECFLVGSHINPYKFSPVDSHEPDRDRKLLLNRSELRKLADQVKLKGLTLIPLKVYFNKRGCCKIEIGLGKGKKLYDKRQDVKKREAEREIARAIKS